MPAAQWSLVITLRRSGVAILHAKVRPSKQLGGVLTPVRSLFWLAGLRSCSPSQAQDQYNGKKNARGVQPKAAKRFSVEMEDPYYRAIRLYKEFSP